MGQALGVLQEQLGGQVEFGLKGLGWGLGGEGMEPSAHDFFIGPGQVQGGVKEQGQMEVVAHDAKGPQLDGERESQMDDAPFEIFLTV